MLRSFVSSRDSLRPITEEKVLTSKALKLIKIIKFIIGTTVANLGNGRRIKRFKENSFLHFQDRSYCPEDEERICLKDWYLCTKIHGAPQKNLKDIFNPLKPELNPICYLLALLGAHHFLHVSRIRVKSLALR